MSSRPAGSPRFATDVNYSTGPKAGTPTKRAFPVGKQARGWDPDERPPPQFQNYLDNVRGEWIDYLDLVDLLNWNTNVPSAALATLGSAFRDVCALSWDATPERLFAIGNGDVLLQSYDGGYNWEDAGMAASSVMLALATGSDATAILLLDTTIKIGLIGTAASFVATSITGADVDMVGTGAFDCAKVVADPVTTQFWVAGKDSVGTGFPAVFRINQTGGTLTSQAKLLAASGNITPTLDLIAKNPTHGIACGSTDLRMFRWANADAALTEVTPPWGSPFAGTAFDLLWDGANGYFLAFAEDSSNDLHVWRSATGDTGSWTEITGQPITVLRASAVGAGCVRGSTVLIPVRNTSPSPDLYFMAASQDGGATWKLLPNPLVWHGSPGYQNEIHRIRNCGRRFGALVHTAAPANLLSLSVACGRTA